MTTAGNYKELVRRLKKQVSLLRRKEKLAANQLKKAIQAMKNLGRDYEKRVAANFKKMKSKIAAAEAAAYLKAAREVEIQVKKKLIEKQKALGLVVTWYEKSFATRLTRYLEQKAKRAAKRK